MHDVKNVEKLYVQNLHYDLLNFLMQLFDIQFDHFKKKVFINFHLFVFYLNRNLDPIRAKFDFDPCLTLFTDVVRKKMWYSNAHFQKCLHCFSS